MSRTLEQSEAFRKEDGVYCLGYRGSIKKEPLEEKATVNPAPIPANLLVNDSYKIPNRRIFGSSSPVASSHRQPPGVINKS
jgi:hypothetical protein